MRVTTSGQLSRRTVSMPFVSILSHTSGLLQYRPAYRFLFMSRYGKYTFSNSSLTGGGKRDVTALAASAQGPTSSAVAREEWPVRGLTAPAEIVVDHWGIPHIFAQSARDAYFLQGYNAARDRLWQIDLWRKRGLGLLSKSFGPDYVEQDRAARLFLYRGDMEKEWAAYAPDARASVAAFTAGLNAYIGDVRAQARPLPASPSRQR